MLSTERPHSQRGYLGGFCVTCHDWSVLNKRQSKQTKRGECMCFSFEGRFLHKYMFFRKQKCHKRNTQVQLSPCFSFLSPSSSMYLNCQANASSKPLFCYLEVCNCSQNFYEGRVACPVTLPIIRGKLLSSHPNFLLFEVFLCNELGCKTVRTLWSPLCVSPLHASFRFSSELCHPISVYRNILQYTL